jgi:hypothetical protein
MNYLLLIRIAFMVIIGILILILINSKTTIYLPHTALWAKMLLILILIPGIPPL